MKSRPLISICVPTYKREYIIDQLIQSILAQKCDPAQYDICITDNSDTDETADLIAQKYSKLDNLHYKKVQCEGFRNSEEALKLGDGYFLKLHNDYSMFHEGSLQKLIDDVKEYSEEKPVLFYTLRNKDRKTEFDTFDDFMNEVNYLSTWSTSFSIWKEDFDYIMNLGIDCNYMYPHTSLLFAETWKKKFVVDDYCYFYNVQPKNKGGYKGKKGYNLIDNFVRIYLGMVGKDLVEKNAISKNTYNRIERNILRFCAKNYVNLNNRPGYTYQFDNRKEIITKQCGASGYMLFCAFVAVYRIRSLLKPNDIS